LLAARQGFLLHLVTVQFLLGINCPCPAGGRGIIAGKADWTVVSEQGAWLTDVRTPSRHGSAQPGM